MRMSMNPLLPYKTINRLSENMSDTSRHRNTSATSFNLLHEFNKQTNEINTKRKRRKKKHVLEHYSVISRNH